jgi:hypothetical protein
VSTLGFLNWFSNDAMIGTTFYPHVKYIGGGEPGGSSIKLVKDPVPQ